MKKFVIESVSGISGNCLLGEGETEAEAWTDAFGPKPWGPSAKRAKREAWVREVSSEELEELEENRANR
jgi:hypothetical protein